ncbi:uncharacterized protein METZ01_LOCUS462984, partial [marine metagenome]
MQIGEKRGNNNPNRGNKQQGLFSNMNDEARQLYYQTEKISPEQAIMYQFAMPLPFFNLGYAYSDNWKKGLKWDLAILGSVLLSELMLDEDPFDHMSGDDDGNDEDVSDLLIVTAVGLSIY